MPRDYANRKASKRNNAAPSKGSTRARRRTPAKAQGTFNPASFVAGLVLGIAATVLAMTIPELTESTATAAAPAPADPINAPRFEFWDKLPDARVASDTTPYEAGTPAATADGKEPSVDKEYLLQAGSFRYRRDADELRASLILAGLNASTTKVGIDDGIWYRVVVGPFASRPESQRALTRLRQRNISALLLERSPSAG